VGQDPAGPSQDFIKFLRRDAAKYRGTDKRVLLSFTSDVYCQPAVQSGLTRQVLEVLREFGIPFQVLTKNGMAAAADFDLYGPNDAFATTLTYRDPERSLKHEPGAAVPSDRVLAIHDAHQEGITTWVSLEPILDPDDALRWIKMTHDIVDLYKIGKVNHDAALEKRIDDVHGWARFAWSAMNLCNKFGKPFILKKDLLAYCDFEIVGAATFDPRKVVRAWE
jgi:DNA repair photolyase